MTKRRVRNALLLAIAAVSASLEAPRLARDPLSELDALRTSSSAARLAANTGGKHLGFDTNIYPGDRAMKAWRQSGEYEWVGYYLEAPCHKDGSWSGTRVRLLDDGWGLAVIYVGQQTWGRKLTLAKTTTSTELAATAVRKTSRSARTMTRRSKTPVAKPGDRCSATFVNAAQGRIDARDAIAKADREGFARSSVLFLDVEYMDVLPPLMRDYYRAWTRDVLADGRYRPGVYTHTRNAATIYADVSEVYSQAGIAADPPFWIAGAGDFSRDRAPTDVGHEFASVWQGALDVMRTHNGVRLPVDISVASGPSPSVATE